MRDMRQRYYNDRIMGYFVYVLFLRDNCYYVGFTKNIETRMNSHYKGSTTWTRYHRPISILWSYDFRNQDDALKMEQIITRYYTLYSGKDAVRGSNWTGLNIKPPAFLYNFEKEWLKDLGFTFNPVDYVKYCQNCGTLNNISYYKYCRNCKKGLNP